MANLFVIHIASVLVFRMSIQQRTSEAGWKNGPKNLFLKALALTASEEQKGPAAALSSFIGYL